MSHYLAAIVLVVSLSLCVYLLTVLWHIHRVHSSAAWKFIFLGLTLLAVECAVGAHLAYISGTYLSIEQVIFVAVILVKAICYAVGFTIWKNDINWLKTLARQRRQQMQDDKERPDHPEHPDTPPQDPPDDAPGHQPPDAEPADGEEPDPPPPGGGSGGDPQGPGK